MRTTLTILALIGLIGCRVTNNYYSIYPTKVIETKMPTLEGDVIYPSWTIDPGFYQPINGGGLITEHYEPGEWKLMDDLISKVDPSIIPRVYNLTVMDGDSVTCTCGTTFYIGSPFELDIDYCPKCNKAY